MNENQQKSHCEGEEAPDWESIAKYKAAELANYIKRNKDAMQNAFSDGRAQVLTGILPILDSIVEAARTVQNPSDRQGIEILQRKFESMLVGFGLEEIPVKVGDAFDPRIHYCACASETTKNTVLEVWQKGFKYAGQVVRPATVKI